MFNPPELSRSGATDGPVASAFGRAADIAAGVVGERVAGRVSGKPIRDAFVAGRASVVQLDEALTRVEEVEQQIRALEAAKLRALSDVRAAAEADMIAENSPVDRGEPLERTMSYRSAVAEVATSLKLSQQTIEQRIEHATILTTLYPTTLATLEAGEISSTHARIIVDAGSIIGAPHDPEGEDAVRDRGRYEARVLEYAKRESTNRLRIHARNVAEEYAYESLDERHQRACTRRSVWVRDLPDGMAELHAQLPAVDAKAIHSRLTLAARRIEIVEKANQVEARAEAKAKAREARAARAAQAKGVAGQVGSAGDAAVAGNESTGAESTGVEGTAEDPRLVRRSRDEIRADVLKDLLLNSHTDEELGEGPEIRGHVQVTTTSEHFTRLTSAAGTSGAFGATDTTGAGDDADDCPLFSYPILEGYGPIDVDSARRVAGDADAWNVVKVSPETGDVLSVDRYRPSEAMKRFIQARDQHCRFPGCRADAYRCDLDHSIDHAHGGKTSTDNLGALCRGHHMLKHHGGWSLTQLPNGDFEWRSPTGRVHMDRPVSRVRFRRAGPEEPGQPDDPGGPGDPPPRQHPRSPRARANAEVSRILAGIATGASASTSAPERVDGPHPF